MASSELDVLIHDLETRHDMYVANLDGAVNALAALLPGAVTKDLTAERLSTTDGVMHVADEAYPNWSVNIHGRANETDGHWRCTLRRSDSRDNDSVIGSGRAPVLSQAILAAVLRLAAHHRTHPAED
ncbi:MAG: hypothetical protein WBF53_06985 [Litorimonas sp.]